MKTNKQRTNWLVDAACFIGLLICLFLDLTGLPLHQWLGLGVGLFAGYHLWLHRDWVKSVTSRLSQCASQQTRTFYLVDVGMLSCLQAILVTGVVISTWLALPFASYAVWRNLHVAISIATVALVVAKIALHWRWVVAVAQRHVFGSPQNRVPAQFPVGVSPRQGRREFLKLMGIVGAAAALGVGTVLQNPKGTLAGESSSAESGATTPGQIAQSQTPSTSCVVRCSKGCSYPGRCRRYTDGNRNGRCDLGECL